MYIISKKKDYYDGVVGTMGVDKEIVYERKTVEYELDDKLVPKEFKKSDNVLYINHFRDLNLYSLDRKNSKYSDAEPFIIGFCGKLYVGFKLYYAINGNPFYDTIKHHVVYDVKILKKHLVRHWKRQDIEDNINYIQNYDAMHIFREFNTPVFVVDFNYTGDIGISKDAFVINPLLKEYKFYKVFDSFRAFQEIQTFISGVLGVNEKEMIEVSNKHKIKQHGFDYKWSFRREPTKNKKNN